MTPADLASLKAEIAQTESTIRNLEHHAKQLAAEADGLQFTLAALKAKLPEDPQE
jgi:septal ring factor EnvC (AmiA/AmiB activator)